MADKKYVPQGVYLACDKGTTPTEFKITNNNNVFLFEEPVANTGDMAPNVNVMPFGACSVKNGSPCVPVPTSWQGFEDGIFIGNFNPLLEDSILPCGLGGKIEIFYSLEEAEAACDDGGMSFWEIVGAAVLVVAAVALIVITGGAAVAAFAAIGAASGALATGIAATVFVAEVAGAAMGVYGLIKYANDGDEEALFYDVALGFLFLGVGKVVEKGFRVWRAGRAVDDAVEIFGEGLEPMLKGKVIDFPNIQKSVFNYVKRNTDEVTELRNAFNRKGRKDFLKNLGNNEDLLRSKGFSDIDIADIKNGRPPDGYQVHHKYPLDDGGTNAPDNLVLIKNDPYHKALTNHQNAVTKGMGAGDSRNVNWYTMEGSVYP